MVNFDEKLCVRAVRDVDPNFQGNDPLSRMNSLKGSVGGALARRLIDQYADLGEWPDSLKELINHLKDDVNGSSKTRQASESP